VDYGDYLLVVASGDVAENPAHVFADRGARVG
jgi:hypothetical protein